MVPRKATPKIEYLTKNRKPIGRPREDEVIFAALTTEFQLVREIQARWPEQPTPSFWLLNKRLQRAMERHPKLIEHVKGRGWRRKTQE